MQQQADEQFWRLLPSPPAPSAQVFAAYRQLQQAQWLPLEHIRRNQLTSLNQLLAHCARHIPFYRRVLQEAGLAPQDQPIGWDQFRRLPVLQRSDYQRHLDELRAEALPDGIVARPPILTSGTTGEPLQIAGTNLSVFWWHAFYLRDLEWAGLDPRGPLAVIKVFAKKPEELPRFLRGVSRAVRNPLLQGLCESGPMFAMDVRQDPRVQLDWLRQVRPHYLSSPASNLEFLASLVRESGQPLAELRAVQIYGEAMTPLQRQRIEAGLGVPVKNLYSSTEAGYMASQCPHGGGLHQHAENFIAEVVDADGKACAPGESGRLLVTTLHNHYGPFIRYEIGDDVTLAAEPCACGRGLPHWQQVDGGKWRPLLQLPDGRRKSSMGLVAELQGMAGVHQFQLVQRRPDHILVRIAPSLQWSAESAQRIAGLVREHMEQQVQVEVETRPFLERPPGGKFRPVLVEVADTAASVNEQSTAG